MEKNNKPDIGQIVKLAPTESEKYKYNGPYTYITTGIGTDGSFLCGDITLIEELTQRSL